MSASSAPSSRARRDPFEHLNHFHTDTHALMQSVKDNPIQEASYTTQELALAEQLRTNVAELMRDEKKMTPTADDYPAGMHQYWTTHWPEGSSHPLFHDTQGLVAADSVPDSWPVHELVRFLRARDMDLKKATRMYFHYRRWRKVYGVAHLASLPSMPFEPLIQSILSHSYHKLDRAGRPLYLQKSGLIDPSRFTNEVSLQRIGVGHTWFSEEMRKRCELGSRIQGKRVEQIVNIIDVKGLGLGARKLLKIFSTTTYIDQHFYPETLAQLWMINVPSFFPPIWSVCKSFLSAKTQAKVRILGANFQAQLLSELGPDCLPVEYGGTCACEGGCCPAPSGVAPPRPGEEDADEDQFVLKSGQRRSVEVLFVPSEADGSALEVWWSVELAARDVEFEVRFRESVAASDQQQEADEEAHTDGAAASASSASASASAAAESAAPSSPTGGVETEVESMRRVSSDQSPLLGAYRGSKPGVLVLSFSNAHARWHSKSVKLRTGTRLAK